MFNPRLTYPVRFGTWGERIYAAAGKCGFYGTVNRTAWRVHSKRYKTRFRFG